MEKCDKWPGRTIVLLFQVCLPIAGRANAAYRNLRELPKMAGIGGIIVISGTGWLESYSLPNLADKESNCPLISASRALGLACSAKWTWNGCAE